MYELQMLWFDHPVNQARTENGLPAINSLWVFGGASRDQFHKKNNKSGTEPDPASAQTHFDLATPHAKHDWGNRSEEHTSELQSLMRNAYAVFCLKKKKEKRQQ